MDEKLVSRLASAASEMNKLIAGLDKLNAIDAFEQLVGLEQLDLVKNVLFLNSFNEDIFDSSRSLFDRAAMQSDHDDRQRYRKRYIKLIDDNLYGDLIKSLNIKAVARKPVQGTSAKNKYKQIDAYLTPEERVLKQACKIARSICRQEKAWINLAMAKSEITNKPGLAAKSNKRILSMLALVAVGFVVVTQGPEVLSKLAEQFSGVSASEYVRSALFVCGPVGLGTACAGIVMYKKMEKKDAPELVCHKKHGIVYGDMAHERLDRLVNPDRGLLSKTIHQLNRRRKLASDFLLD